jgi:hypothetical protein
MTHKRKPGSPGRPPTPFTLLHGVTEREQQALIVYAVTGHQSVAATRLGISVQTFKNLLQTARRRVQAAHIFDVYMRLGWLVLPDEQPYPEGTISDTMLIHGHHFVHVAACPCLPMQAEVARLNLDA